MKYLYFLRKYKDFTHKCRIARFSLFFFVLVRLLFLAGPPWAGRLWRTKVYFSSGNTKISWLGVPKNTLYVRKNKEFIACVGSLGLGRLGLGKLGLGRLVAGLDMLVRLLLVAALAVAFAAPAFAVRRQRFLFFS